MKTSVARAMQISILTSDEIQKVHALEKKKQTPIANWNIQQLLNSKSVCEVLGIPADDLNAQAIHLDRIDRLLKNYGFPDPWDYLNWLHSFDWFVHKNPDRIKFRYEGPQKTNNIRSKLQAL